MRLAMAKNTCETCRFWSDRIAHFADAEMEAMCLNEHSPFNSMFVPETNWCLEWAENTDGAIDDLDLPFGAYGEGVGRPEEDDKIDEGDTGR
jgi:hypothetical protein